MAPKVKGVKIEINEFRRELGDAFSPNEIDDDMEERSGKYESSWIRGRVTSRQNEDKRGSGMGGKFGGMDGGTGFTRRTEGFGKSFDSSGFLTRNSSEELDFSNVRNMSPKTLSLKRENDNEERLRGYKDTKKPEYRNSFFRSSETDKGRNFKDISFENIRDKDGTRLEKSEREPFPQKQSSSFFERGIESNKPRTFELDRHNWKDSSFRDSIDKKPFSKPGFNFGGTADNSNFFKRHKDSVKDFKIERAGFDTLEKRKTEGSQRQSTTSDLEVRKSPSREALNTKQIDGSIDSQTHRGSSITVPEKISVNPPSNIVEKSSENTSESSKSQAVQDVSSSEDLLATDSSKKELVTRNEASNQKIVVERHMCENDIESLHPVSEKKPEIAESNEEKNVNIDATDLKERAFTGDNVQEEKAMISQEGEKSQHQVSEVSPEKKTKVSETTTEKTSRVPRNDLDANSPVTQHIENKNTLISKESEKHTTTIPKDGEKKPQTAKIGEKYRPPIPKEGDGKLLKSFSDQNKRPAVANVALLKQAKQAKQAEKEKKMEEALNKLKEKSQSSLKASGNNQAPKKKDSLEAGSSNSNDTLKVVLKDMRQMKLDEEFRRRKEHEERNALKEECLERLVVTNDENLVKLEEMVSKVLEDQQNADELLNFVKEFWSKSYETSIAPVVLIVKQLILKIIGNLGKTVEKGLKAATACTSHDSEIMSKAGEIVRRVKPALKYTLKHGSFKNDKIRFLYVTQEMVQGLGLPRLTPGLALIEALWDALYTQDVIEESFFDLWYNDIHDETLGRQDTFIQMINWFEWLHAPFYGVEEDVEAASVSSSEEED